jgi:hypothetical protein
MYSEGVGGGMIHLQVIGYNSSPLATPLIAEIIMGNYCVIAGAGII